MGGTEETWCLSFFLHMNIYCGLETNKKEADGTASYDFLENLV